jgi:predicted unusual protein kinase regulating ubiquinone biosynthesis (AarF/ABC1/UbiB family)
VLQNCKPGDFVDAHWWGLKTVKFRYRVVGCYFAGGMTELKKKEKRKRLAKWVKEGLLRLGPTFIKIGQQFSTRVDILAQEYVDELAELQVSSTNCNLFAVAIAAAHDLSP